MRRPSYNAKREKIAKIAARVFSKEGYQKASLQDVAVFTGNPKSVIYHYFKTKEDILANVLLTNSDEFINILESCLNKNKKLGGDAESSFRNLVRSYAKFQIKNKVSSHLVLRERHQLTGENKRQLYEKEQKIFRLVKNELNKIPDLNKNINLSLISFIIIAMCHWMGYWLNEKGGLRPEEAINQSIEIIFGGIRYADIHPDSKTSDKNTNFQKCRTAKS